MEPLPLFDLVKQGDQLTPAADIREIGANYDLWGVVLTARSPEPKIHKVEPSPEA